MAKKGKSPSSFYGRNVAGLTPPRVARLDHNLNPIGLEPRVAVGSTLLQRLAAQTWHEVTDGKGVTLVDGQPVPVDGGKS